MQAIQTAYPAARASATWPASEARASDKLLGQRVRDFDRLLSTALTPLCARPSFDAFCGARGGPAQGCPVLCRRVRRGFSPGLAELFDAAEAQAPTGKIFFSTDCPALQDFVERFLSDRLVMARGPPTHSRGGRDPCLELGAQCEDAKGTARAGAVKAAADLLLFLDSQQVFQLANSTFSAVAAYSFAPQRVRDAPRVVLPAALRPWL